MLVELDKFVSEHPGNDNDPPANEKKLGFTLSYSMDQTAVICASAIKWKSFSADHTVRSTAMMFPLHIQWLSYIYRNYAYRIETYPVTHKKGGQEFEVHQANIFSSTSMMLSEI